MPFQSLLERVLGGRGLDAEQAHQAMREMLSGRVSSCEIAGFLVALRLKGETVEELLGFTHCVREKGVRVDAGSVEHLVDTCGTGGDLAGTFNISTVAAFVAAGAGACVAKHGNRSISSQCGSADVLEELGVRICLSAEQAAQSIRKVGIGFLFSAAMHPAMQYVQAARRDLKIRTVCNLLGPLCNPAGARAQVIGAPSPRAARLIAGVLTELRPARAFVVHGSDGLDEITLTGPSLIYEVEDCQMREYVWSPADFGFAKAPASALRGGDKRVNAEITRQVLSGAPGVPREIVLMNAAVALMAAGKASGHDDAIQRASESIDSGAAMAKLRRLVEVTQSFSAG